MKNTEPSQIITLVEQFLASLKRQPFRPKTIISRRKSLNRFNHFLTTIAIDRFQDVTVHVLRQYREYLTKNNLSANTRDIHLYALRQFFDHLEAQGLLFENPTRAISLHQKSNGLPSILTEDECKRLFHPSLITTDMDKRNHLILLLLWECALRTRELLTLTIFDFDQTQKTLRVLGNNRRQRILSLSDSLATRLIEHLQRIRQPSLKHTNPDSSALFLDRSGNPLSLGAFQQLLRTYGIKAKLSRPLSCPLLRRTAITHKLQNGADPVTLAAALGYTQVYTLARYLKTTVPKLKKKHQTTKTKK